MSQLRVSSVATTAGVANVTLSANGVGLDNKPIISGQMGSFASPTGGQVLAFDDFWVQRGISYNSSTKRFTVPVAGIYRITLNPFTTTNGTRVMIGVNTDTPNNSTGHRGHIYHGNTGYTAHSMDSIVQLNANDYVVFYLSAGTIYNNTTDRFNQFSIERIA